MGCITPGKRQSLKPSLQTEQKPFSLLNFNQRSSIPLSFQKQSLEINGSNTVAQPPEVNISNVTVEKTLAVKQNTLLKLPIILKQINMVEQFQQYQPVSQRKIAREYLKLQKTKVELPLE